MYLALTLTLVMAAGHPPASAQMTLTQCRMVDLKHQRSTDPLDENPDAVLRCVKRHGYDMAWATGECSIFNDRTPATCLRKIRHH
jgi:hypothetical protein